MYKPALSKLIACRLAPTALLIATAATASAQQFGGNPPSIHWQQINTPAAKVIFPQGMDSVGQRVANIIQRMDGLILPTLGNRRKQVSILLQNQTTVTNGYVGLAPFRSEFYLTPQQNSLELGGIPWPDMLSVHEYRHVQQYNNFNVGLTRVLSTLFGEGGQALGNSLSVPDWFFEGDAVYNETLLSQQGRGRLPWFFKDYRALWAADKNYNWMKLRNGSFVDFVPTHYPLGYMLVAYGREKYGDDFWRKVTYDAAAYKYGFYPLQQAIKKHAGTDYKTFRRDALDYFKKQYQDEAPSQASNPKQHFVADEEFPAFVNDSTVVYLKVPYNHLPAFVVRTGNTENQIGIRGLANDRHFSYRDGKLVYAGYRPSLRWGFKNYNEIRVVDMATGRDRAITTKTKYFSPDISPDGKTIAAVDVAPSGKRSLHVLDADSGCLIKTLPNPDNLFYTYPKFHGNNQLITAVRNEQGMMAIVKVNTQSGEHKILLSFTIQPIAQLSLYKDTVYFTATTGKNDRLFAMPVSGNKLYVLDPAGQTGIGHYQPAASQHKLAWTGFTAYGNQLQIADKSDVKWVEVSSSNLPGGLSVQDINKLDNNQYNNTLTDTTESEFKVEKYSKSHNLFNFHSLIPDISDPDYRFSLRGENVLNTFSSDLFFNYNRNEGYKQAGFNATYGALFPYLSGGVDYIFDRRGYSLRNQSYIYWNELNLYGGLQVPLNFTRGRNINGLSIGSDVYYTRSDFRGGFGALDRSFVYLNNYLSLSTRIQQARQHIYPHWGQSILFIYKSGLSLNANQFLASGNFYLPGILANDNFIITAAYQQHGRDNAINFSNNFPFSRGYTAENLYKMYKAGINYHFPIAYPDAGVANTAYLLRVRGNAFFEHTHGMDFYNDGSRFKADFNSVGMAVFFDTKFFNQQSLSFGIRYSRLLNRDYFGGNGPNRIELVLPVSIF